MFPAAMRDDRLFSRQILAALARLENDGVESAIAALTLNASDRDA
ncbi:hypothetical protein [Salinicola acroporae]